jgi:hypothetical protein
MRKFTRRGLIKRVKLGVTLMTSHETYHLGRALLIGGMIVWRFWRMARATRRRTSQGQQFANRSQPIPATEAPSRQNPSRTTPSQTRQEQNDHPLQSRDPFDSSH